MEALIYKNGVPVGYHDDVRFANPIGKDVRTVSRPPLAASKKKQRRAFICVHTNAVRVYLLQ